MKPAVHRLYKYNYIVTIIQNSFVQVEISCWYSVAVNQAHEMVEERSDEAKQVSAATYDTCMQRAFGKAGRR